MASSSSNTLERRIRRSDPSTIQDKFLVGYQGWFTCAGDGEQVGPGHHGWLHWFNYPMPDGGRPNTDLWPDTSSYSPSELYPAPGLKTKTGEQVFLFSSRNRKTVQRHFHWMAEHGVDGAFLQRFAGETDLEAGNEGMRRIRDEVGDRVREAAEKEGRVFAIMYDVSGVPADRIGRVLERDWVHLMHEKGVLDSPNYLKEKGKPVIALWGFGMEGAGHSPALIRSIVAYFRSVTPGGVYIMAGVPAHWRTSEGDADRDPRLVDVWLDEFDAISPWTIGRYSDEREADNFAETKMKGDFELIKRRVEEGRRKIDYIPVVFPGGSGYNLSEGKWGWNDIKRNGGRFLWKQVYNARKLGIRTMYGAMWDEYDEGTAFMPVVPHRRLLPESDKFKFMALDEDGYDLPSDWYMRICGFAAEVLRNERRIFETFPSKELQDYWSSRPKYEDIPIQAAASSSSSSGVAGAPAGSSGKEDKKPGDAQSYEEWLATQGEEKEEAPPPPYSLEAEEVPATALTTTNTNNPAAAASSTAPTQTPVTAPAVNSPASGPSSVIPSSHSSAPPNVNASTHPSQQSHGLGFGAPDPVTSLASDFGRASLSSAVPSNPNQPGANSSFSPPPLHPAHPAAASSGYSGHGRPQPNLSTRPNSASGRPQPQVNMASHPSASQPPQGYPSPHQPQPQVASGPWSQAQWPPPEWGVNNTNSSSTPYATYSPSGTPGGANLTRPHTFSAGHHSAPSVGGGANLRPSATIGGHGSQGRPDYGGPSPGPNYGPGPNFPGGPGAGPGAGPSFPMGPSGFGGPSLSSYPSPGTSPYPGQRPVSPYPPMGPGPAASSGGPPEVSSYSGQQTSTYPGQQSYYPHPSHHTSPPHSPPAGTISYPTTTSDPSTGGPAGYHPSYQSPSGTYSGPGYAPHGTSSPPPPGHGPGMHFPQGPGGYGHGPGSGPGPMGGSAFPGAPQSGYGGGYPPQNQYGQPGGQYGQHGGQAFPQAGAGTGPGSWTPGPGGPTAFPPPPRPNSYSNPSSSGPNFPVASTASSQAIGLALSAVDKVAGKKTRNQLEGLFGKLK